MAGWTVVVLAFLFIPILLVVLHSFNGGGSFSIWAGHLTTDWWFGKGSPGGGLDSPVGLFHGDTVVAAARACAAAFLAGGVLPVLKHIPGYGRAAVDSHHDLPRVSAPFESLMTRDFAPFVALNDVAIGMTAHIVFDAIDPDAPATTSAAMLGVIRDDIGFDGLIMTDDLSMNALQGSLRDRATAALAAGCDLILQCNGQPDDMLQVAAVVPGLTTAAVVRADRALAQRKPPEPCDINGLEAELDALSGAGQ